MSVFRILTATYTDRVETLSFDPDAKSLSITSSLTVGHHPSWITPHPENPAIWFTGLEQDDGRVVAIEYDEDGKGKVVGELSSEGADPCTLVAYKGDLLIGNVSFVPSSPRVVRIFTTLIRGSTLCLVFWRKCRCAPPHVLPTVHRAIHDEALAQRFRSGAGSTAFISPSSGGPPSDPR